MSERIDCLVIGAGVVGLAVARALAQSGREVIVLEAEETIGTGVSSRNSEVIHAGIYYPRGSAKARLCVEGRRLLYEYCAVHGVEHRRCGKLVVATDEAQLAQLNAIESTARTNGVNDLRWIEAAEAAQMEPALRCVAALHSPSTGIVDSHGLMCSLRGEIERLGGAVQCRAPVRRGFRDGGRMRLEAGAANELVTLDASVVVNSAGLGAQEVARRLAVHESTIPPLHYAKGNYFSLPGRSPFRRLIYPVPEPGGLGVHATVDLAGRARFGPDVEWIDAVDDRVDPGRAGRFYAAIRNYWPGLPDNALQPAYCGIRPKLSGPAAPAADFLIQAADAHGVPGLINLYGIESPGLTAALAIAEAVAAIAQTAL
ncbi:MAG: NAD(P)/FAD-dependent oxidoreductase [Steroidobacteraceae bacterium]